MVRSKGNRFHDAVLKLWVTLQTYVIVAIIHIFCPFDTESETSGYKSSIFYGEQTWQHCFYKTFDHKRDWQTNIYLYVSSGYKFNANSFYSFCLCFIPFFYYKIQYNIFSGLCHQGQLVWCKCQCYLQTLQQILWSSSMWKINYCLLFIVYRNCKIVTMMILNILNNYYWSIISVRGRLFV